MKNHRDTEERLGKTIGVQRNPQGKNRKLMGIHRKSIGKPQNYSNPEETKGKHYENHRKPWESDSNLWGTIGNHRKTMGKR